jgi:hypothetical protein
MEIFIRVSFPLREFHMVMAFFNAQIFINTADPSKTANSMATELC